MEMNYGIVKRFRSKRAFSGLYMYTLTKSNGNLLPERVFLVVSMEFGIETDSFYERTYLLDIIKKLV